MLFLLINKLLVVIVLLVIVSLKSFDLVVPLLVFNYLLDNFLHFMAYNTSVKTIFLENYMVVTLIMGLL